MITISNTGLVVPLRGGDKIYVCFKCIHILETLTKHQKYLRSSQIFLTSIRPIKANDQKERPLKLNSLSLPKMRKCVVSLEKLNPNATKELIANGTSSFESQKKVVKNTVKTRLQNDLSKAKVAKNLRPTRQSKKDLFVLVADVGYHTNGEALLNIEGRAIRKRKQAIQDDFIYFAKNNRTIKASEESPTKKTINKKLSQKPPKSLKRTSKHSLDVQTKPCVVKLQRVRVADLKLNKAQNVDGIKKEPKSEPLKLQNGYKSENCNSPQESSVYQNGYESHIDRDPLALSCKQNENSTPNIPKVALNPDVRDEAKCNENIDVSTSSATQVFVRVVAYKESEAESAPLTPDQFRDANVSDVPINASNLEELMPSTPDFINVIELEDLHDFNFDNLNQLDNEEQYHDDEDGTRNEMDRVIDEIISQHFE